MSFGLAGGSGVFLVGWLVGCVKMCEDVWCLVAVIADWRFGG